MTIFNQILPLITAGTFFLLLFSVVNSSGLKVRLAPKNLTQYRSQYVVFRCYVAGNPYPIVSWYANDQRITEGPRHKFSSIKGGYMLRIGRLHPILDTAIIECRARNGVDSPVADHASLNVSFNYFWKVKIPDYKPQTFVDRRRRFRNVYVGANITLNANFSGYPTPTITWFKDMKLLDFKNPRFTLLENNSLRICNSEHEDSGMFDFLVENSAGQMFSLPWHVTVKYVKSKPKILKGLRNQVVDPEGDILLKCSASGHPTPVLRWENSKKTVLEELTGILHLRKVMKSETYTCFAKNDLGESSFSVNVTLSGLPFRPKNLKINSTTSDSITLTWEDGQVGTTIEYHTIQYRKPRNKRWTTVFTEKPVHKHKVKDLTPFTYYEFQVLASNYVGSSKPSKVVRAQTDETVPGSPPSSIVVKSTETGSFQASWQPPLHPNGHISFYTVYYSEKIQAPFDSWKAKTAHRHQNTLKISSLIANHRYAVKISASTYSGAGPISPTFLVQTLKGVPGDPKDVQITHVSSSSLTVMWKIPTYVGSDQGIVGYDIYYNKSLKGPHNKVIIQSPRELQRTVSGLRPVTTYEISVAARGDAGSGPLSFPQYVTTLQSVPSAPPSNLSCKALDERSVKCSWLPPPLMDRNGDITGYEIRYKISIVGENLQSLNTSGIFFTVFSLLPFTKYHIEIAAKTSKGRGPFSMPFFVTTHETIPTKRPENLTAVAINSTAILVTWEAPSPPFGANLTGFNLLYRRKPQDKKYTKMHFTAHIKHKVITQLIPEQYYEFLVAARSSKGRGLYTDLVTCKTKDAPPLPPILFSKKISSPQLGFALEWTSKADNIQHFKLKYAKDIEKITNVTDLRYLEKVFPSTVTEYNVTNIGHGLWYIFKISVKNDAGWSRERSVMYFTDPSIPSGAPINFIVKSKNSTSALLSWKPPGKWKRNGKIVGYELSYEKTGFSETKPVPIAETKRSCVVRGLQPFTTYHFWILAKTKIGSGPKERITVTTNEDVPSDAPTITDARGMGTKVIRLRFTSPLQPNGLIIGYKVNIFLGNKNAEMWKSDELKENKNEMYIKKLAYPNATYWFTIAARTSVGEGPFSQPFAGKTLKYDILHPVRKLSFDGITSNSFQVLWESPIDSTAVQSYKVTFQGKKSFVGGDKKLIKKTFDKEVRTVKCCGLTLKNLKPNTNYIVSVASEGTSSRASEVKTIKIKTDVAASPVFSSPNISRSAITEEYIPIYLFAASNINGIISHYLINVASLGKTLSEARKNLNEIQSSRTRRAVDESMHSSNVYVTAKVEAGLVPLMFKVGRGEIENGYTNKPLINGHYYAFSVKSCVLSDKGLCLGTTTKFTEPVKFIPVVVSALESDNNNNGLGIWLLGPIVGVLIVLIVLVLACLLCRRRAKRRRNGLKSLKGTVNDEELPMMMMTAKDPVELQRLNLASEGMREHPPIDVCNLRSTIDELRSDNRFTREYESIDPGMTFVSEASARHLNQSKNRYPNIVPYDHTRVTLQDTNGFLDSDYINASYMAGYRKSNAYIATQAPLTNTINDFWQMIWEQDCRTIVMMTNLQERSRRKCDQYWPNQSSEKFGNITVVVLETTELAHYTVRTFRLHKDGTVGQFKKIKQFQYTAWPDHGVPYYSTSLLCFIRKVRLSNPPDVGPVVVHCSAGVGRTGVFIVIDSMLEKIRMDQKVDIYGHVTYLRSQRNHMVQTEEQYVFIHEALLEAVLFSNTEVDISYLSKYYKTLNEIGENETIGIEQHFKQLSANVHQHRFNTAALAINKSKNRDFTKLPYEHSRVDLFPIRGMDGSNYINASYIDGYKHRHTYIAAQNPLEETVNDSWRMIMEKKCSIIVMLSETDADNEISAKYWPSEHSSKYHFYIVDPVSVEETPNFTLRQFKVNDMMSSSPSLIKLFQLRKWPDRGKPQSYKAILDLIGQVHIARNNDGTRGPVVVHCSSGSGRTGVFCALSIVVERMRAEGVVDLLQTVRELREQRPQMVETVEQYTFCYEAALQYLSSFDHITA